MKASIFRTVSAVVISGSVALGASACTTVSSSGGGKSSSASSSSSSPAAGASESSSSSSSSDDSAGGSGSGGLVTGKVGQDVKTDKYSVKVNKVTDNVKPSNDFETPDAGKRYVDVNVTITNTNSSRKIIVSDYDVKAHLSDNTSPTPSIVSGVGTQLSSDGLFKGDSTSGDVVYQVPQGQKIQYLDFDLDDFSIEGGQTIRVQIN